MTKLRMALIFALMLAVAACGVRGPPEKPPGTKPPPKDDPFVLDPLIK
ncbi:MAG: lipoprotein [Hyphomicrobiales bacterium]